MTERFIVYTLLDHGAMIADDVRMNAYVRAIERVITPQSCVVDVGAGSGIFALMAAKLGARRVYAIEPDDIIGLARRLIDDNGLTDRITLIQADARDVVLEERADVMVSDIGGHLPWHGSHLPAINHARTRFLKQGGAMIPAVDRIFAAVVSGDNLDRRNVWHQAPHGLDLSAAAEPASSELRIHNFNQADRLSDPVAVAALDYRAPLAADLKEKLELNIIREGTACGVALWFDRELGKDILFENGPAGAASQKSRRIYSQVLFPWPKDVDLVAGDSVRLTLAARYSGEDYDWSWDSLIHTIAAGKVQGIRYQQSTLAPKNGGGASNAKLNDEGKALRLCLALMNSGACNEDIANALMREFAQRYPRRDTALAHVAALCREYA